MNSPYESLEKWSEDWWNVWTNTEWTEEYYHSINTYESQQDFAVRDSDLSPGCYDLSQNYNNFNDHHSTLESDAPFKGELYGGQESYGDRSQALPVQDIVPHCTSDDLTAEQGKVPPDFSKTSDAGRTNPPENNHRLHKQNQRFEGDLYTAQWVRGEGAKREGWCGFCSTWHKLKDSAFW